MKIVFIGAGNLATRLSLEMQRVGFTIAQIYSRTESSARSLAGQLGCAWTDRIETVIDDAEVYIFSVKDAALPGLVSEMKANGGVWLHTAGSMPLDVFEGKVARYGVIYPLQTFSKVRPVTFSAIPFFLEANTGETEFFLQNIASALSEKIQFLSSEKRKKLHLAAVFACNFTNHIYALSAKLLEEEGIDRNVLLPLIDETASKIHTISPAEAQTGPAVRYDENVICKHLEMLQDPGLKAIYRLLSESIHKEAVNE